MSGCATTPETATERIMCVLRHLGCDGARRVQPPSVVNTTTRQWGSHPWRILGAVARKDSTSGAAPCCG